MDKVMTRHAAPSPGASITMRAESPDRVARLLGIAALLWSGWTVPVDAQTARPASRPPEDLTRKLDHALTDQIANYDWQAEAPLIKSAIRKVFKSNRWTGEPNEFVLEMIEEVSNIPPWQPMKRIECVSGLLADRYDLSDAAIMRLKTKIMMEMGSFLGENGDLILSHAREAMNARISGQPFTAEQVARWIEEGEPIRRAAEAAAERMISEIETIAGPDGRATLQRDIKAYEQRLADINRMREVWRKGGWKAEDWGMDEDPIQTGQHPGMKTGIEKPDVTTAPAPRLPTKWLTYDQSTWIAYVIQFRERYDFDAAQLTTIESIHDEMVRRADAYTRSRSDLLERIEPKERETHRDLEPVRALFAELVERLDTVPTSGQRDAAEQ